MSERKRRGTRPQRRGVLEEVNLSARISERLDRAWQQGLSEVDNQIVDYYRTVDSFSPATLSKLHRRLAVWFRGKHYDPELNGGVEEFVGAPDFEQRIEARISHLDGEGRINGSSPQRSFD